MKKLNSKLDNDTRRLFQISSGSPINKQKSSALQGIISTLDLCRAQNAMPSTIGKYKLFRIKHVILLEGETFLRNKNEILFFEIKCTFFGRKENTISQDFDPASYITYVMRLLNYGFIDHE